MKAVWFLLSLCLFIGCKHKEVIPQEAASLPIVDLNASYPEKKINLAEVAKSEYIPLYTVSPDSIDGYLLAHASISPQWIVAYNRAQTVMVFERTTGKLRYRFNHRGRQKEQYYYLFSVFVDEEREEIYVVSSIDKLNVYSLSGKYKRTLTPPSDKCFDQVLDYNKDSLIFSDGEEDMDHPIEKGTYYYLMSKDDGGTASLPFYVKHHITNNFRFRFKNENSEEILICRFSIDPLLKDGNEVILSDFSCDTVFSYSKDGFKPLLVRTPAPRSTFPLKLMAVSFRSERFLFLDVVDKVYKRDTKNNDGNTYVYDYQTKEVYVPVVVDSEFTPELPVDISNNRENYPKNTGVSYLPSRKLMQYYREGNLQGQAREAASRLKRDDIYVLVLHHFNEMSR